MKKLIAFTTVFLTCAQCMSAETQSTGEIPTGKALEQQLSGKRVLVENAPKGTFLSFLKGGVLKQESRGWPDELDRWEIEGQMLCFEGRRPRSCAVVTKLTNHDLFLIEPGAEENRQTVEMHFVNQDGVLLQDVIAYDGVLAGKLRGRVITTEDVNPSEILKGSKTVWDFETKDRVSMTAFDASGFPFPGGTVVYNSKDNDLCLTPPDEKPVCIRVEISGSDVRMTPLQNGALVEKEAMVGTIE
ncbi:hypothetical protein [Epibacterium ulvae]|uniref:hypothetical protein n=1 Tax=Epibacterium ulvae TaxID=1156985 RepID=UPI0024922E82|nr:hypothetical protein [Epibacterium ulvae]